MAFRVPPISQKRIWFKTSSKHASSRMEIAPILRDFLKTCKFKVWSTKPSIAAATATGYCNWLLLLATGYWLLLLATGYYWLLLVATATLTGYCYWLPLLLQLQTGYWLLATATANGLLATGNWVLLLLLATDTATATATGYSYCYLLLLLLLAVRLDKCSYIRSSPTKLP